MSVLTTTYFIELKPSWENRPNRRIEVTVIFALFQIASDSK